MGFSNTNAEEQDRGGEQQDRAPRLGGQALGERRPNPQGLGSNLARLRFAERDVFESAPKGGGLPTEICN